MKQFTQQEVLQKYEKLPQAVQDAMFAEATAEKMEEIGRKHGLLIDAIGTLATETGYVMVGLVHPKDFTARIADAVGVSAMKARDIANDINEGVFKPIRTHMLTMYNIQDSSGQTIPKPPPSFTIPPPAGGPTPSFAQTPLQKPAVPVVTEKIAPMIFPEKLQPPVSPSSPAIPPAPLFMESLAQDSKVSTPLPEQQKEEAKPPAPDVRPVPATIITGRSGPDPYREAVD